MKTFCSIVKYIVIVACILFIVTPLIAMDFSAGARVYYAWWEPAWRGEVQNMKSEPAFMIGPVLSVGFLEKWSLTGSFMMNWDNVIDNSFKTSYEFSGISGYDVEVEAEQEYNRGDLDVTLGYKLSKRLSAFAGIKMFQSGAIRGVDRRSNTVTYGGNTYKDVRRAH